MVFPKSSVFILIWLLCFTALTQSRTLSGKQVSANKKNGPVDLVVQGEVIATEGPVSGALVYAFYDERTSEAVSNANGKFQINLDSDEPAKILIVAAGKISQIHSLDPNKKSKIEIQLEDQSSLLTGRIIDNQGMNVTDAKLRVLSLRQNNEMIDIPAGLKNEHLESSTNNQGIFEFAGIDRSMVGSINVTAPGTVTSSITSASFEDKIVLVAQPAQIVRGKVFDRVSKQPITNAVVSQMNGGQRTEVDASGRFELAGLPAFQPLLLLANPSGEKPYLANALPVPAEHGFNPMVVEIDLEPGVWVKCKVRDFGTGGPARAEMFYFPTPANENSQSFVETVQARGVGPSSSTNSSGDAKLVAIPGPGVIAISAQGFPPNESVSKLTDEQRAMLLQITGRNDLTAVAWIDPKNLNDEVELNFLVSKGRTIDIELDANQVEVTDPLVVHRAASKTSYAQNVLGPKLVAEQFQPGETRQILIHSIRKRLGAILNVKAEAQSPVQVELESTGSIVGQVVNKTGEPQSGLLMKFEVPSEDGYQEIETAVFTDANGRFEKSSLIASLEYRIDAVRLMKSQPALMEGSPMMDSQWYVAENLKINSGEEVDLGSVVLEATNQPAPIRRPRNNVVDANNVLPSIISGVVTNDAGEPIADATISFNTWPNRSGDFNKDLELTPTILAQTRSDSVGNFQMNIDGSLEEKVVVAETSDGKQNAAIVVVAEELGTSQIQLHEIKDPRNLNIQLVREMVVRGTISGANDSDEQVTKLTTGSSVRVYDVESINQIVARLQKGISLEMVSREFQPVLTLDPLAGGLPLNWETSSSGVFLVRSIPINAIFELHAYGELGQRKTVTVISRPMRGFDFKPADDSPATMRLQGSRIRLDLRD